MSDRAMIEALAARLGADAVHTDEEALALAASDLHMTGERPAAMVVPTDAAQVAGAIEAAAALGYAIIPRGGGLSYTGGYASPRAKAITVDMRAMNRILDIAEEDLTISVQTGVTWKQIYDALKPRGLRLPFFGTFSGAGATVGGGLSHGALFFGSARHGSAADIVLDMEVALADGTLLRTGRSALSHPARPLLRGFGPDLTGLFTHDGGMLGIKTEASFRLIRAPAEQDHASFAFATLEAAADALSEIARADLAEEVYILDPSAADSLRADTATMAKTALSVTREAGSALKAAKALGSLARGRTGFIPEGHFSLHLTAAGRIAAAVRADIDTATRIATERGGVAIAPTIPRVARAAPFVDLNGVVSPKGGRWAALNAKVAHSEARGLIAAFEALIAPQPGRWPPMTCTSPGSFPHSAPAASASRRCFTGTTAGCPCIARRPTRAISRASRKHPPIRPRGRWSTGCAGKPWRCFANEAQSPARSDAPIPFARRCRPHRKACLPVSRRYWTRGAS